jgi:beta-N-acetylhexosaminidase
MSAARESVSRMTVLVWREPRCDAAAERRLRALRPGGVLVARDAIRSPDATADLLARFARAAGGPLLTALEEKGGAVDPLSALLPPLPAPRAVASRGPAAVKRLGELIGRASKQLGFNTNFAPLLDLETVESSSGSRWRTFGVEAREVTECGRAFLAGMSHEKILACAGHFPGESSARPSAESQLPVSGRPMAALWREDLVPYRALRDELPMVRLSSAWFKAYDFDAPVPATLSASVIEVLLRVKVGYAGAVISANLSAPPLSNHCSATDAAVKAVSAGCDAVVVHEEEAEAVRKALENAGDAGGLSPERLSRADSRLRELRRRITLPTGKVSTRAFDRLAREFEEFSKEFSSGA